MQLSLSVRTVESALKILGPVIPKTPTSLPILSTVLVTVGQGITLRATDLELDVTIGVTGTAVPSGSPKMVFDLRALGKFVKGLPKDSTVSITHDDEKNQITFSTERVRAFFAAQDVKEFPKERAFPKPYKQKVDFDAMGHVLGAVSKDDSRPILGGVNVAGTETAATDSYRLYICEGPTAVDKPFLVPWRTAKILASIGGVNSCSFSDGGRDIRIQAEGFSLTSVLIDGDFPPYHRLIPEKNDVLLRFDEPDFAKHFAHLANLANAFPALQASPCKFESDPGGIKATVRGGSVPWDNAEVSSIFPGHCDMTIAFNYRYLAEALNGAEVETVEGRSALQPCLIRWDDAPYKHTRLVMPVRMS